jgi:hypothetical protein
LGFSNTLIKQSIGIKKKNWWFTWCYLVPGDVGRCLEGIFRGDNLQLENGVQPQAKWLGDKITAKHFTMGGFSGASDLEAALRSYS